MPGDEWKLTIRHGSTVRHESFSNLSDGITAMESEAREIKSEGPLDEVSAIREYTPSVRTHARLELSSGGLFRSRTAGVDVMGDGRFVAFRGSVVRRELDVQGFQTPFEAIENHLRLPGR